MFSNASDRSGPNKGKMSLTSLYLKKITRVLYKSDKEEKTLVEKRHRWMLLDWMAKKGRRPLKAPLKGLKKII